MTNQAIEIQSITLESIELLEQDPQLKVSPTRSYQSMLTFLMTKITPARWEQLGITPEQALLKLLRLYLPREPECKADIEAILYANIGFIATYGKPNPDKTLATTIEGAKERADMITIDSNAMTFPSEDLECLGIMKRSYPFPNNKPRITPDQIAKVYFMFRNQDRIIFDELTSILKNTDPTMEWHSENYEEIIVSSFNQFVIRLAEMEGWVKPF